uniref:Uncharacterized protein n=1 Tax=Arundo donax TaxID=35708 RepID=A0A0A9HPP6_ARUDO
MTRYREVLDICPDVWFMPYTTMPLNLIGNRATAYCYLDPKCLDREFCDCITDRTFCY